MAQVVQAHIWQVGTSSHALPDLRQPNEVLARDIASKHIRVVSEPRLSLNQGQCRGSDWDRLRACLARRQAEIAVLAINVCPLKLQHFGLARAGEQEQPDGASRRWTLGLRRCPRGLPAPAGLDPGG